MTLDPHQPVRLLRPVTLAKASAPDFAISGCAYRINLDGIDTIDQTVTVTLRSAPDPELGIRLEAPRDSIRPRECFALRYFMREGARRAVVLCTAVRPRVGMVDVVEGRVVEDPQQASERDAVRRAVDVDITARVVKSVTVRDFAQVALNARDVSATGLGFRTQSLLGAGDVLHLHRPGTSQAQVALEVVRRAADGFTYGGRFVDRSLGAVYSLLVNEQHRLQEEAEKRARAKSVPVQHDEEEAPEAAPIVEMYTRAPKRPQPSPRR